MYQKFIFFFLKSGPKKYFWNSSMDKAFFRPADVLHTWEDFCLQLQIHQQKGPFCAFRDFKTHIWETTTTINGICRWLQQALYIFWKTSTAQFKSNWRFHTKFNWSLNWMGPGTRVLTRDLKPLLYTDNSINFDPNWFNLIQKSWPCLSVTKGLKTLAKQWR